MHELSLLVGGTRWISNGTFEYETLLCRVCEIKLKAKYAKWLNSFDFSKCHIWTHVVNISVQNELFRVLHGYTNTNIYRYIWSMAK